MGGLKTAVGSLLQEVQRIAVEQIDTGDGLCKLDRSVGESMQRKIELAMLDEDERNSIVAGMLSSIEEQHIAAMNARHGRELVFPRVATACRVFGRVEEVGISDGIKIAIDNIRAHARGEAKKAAVDAVDDVAPVMYDAKADYGKLGTATEKVITTAVYILTEEEMVILEQAIIDKVMAENVTGL